MTVWIFFGSKECDAGTDGAVSTRAKAKCRGGALAIGQEGAPAFAANRNGRPTALNATNATCVTFWFFERI